MLPAVALYFLGNNLHTTHYTLHCQCTNCALMHTQMHPAHTQNTTHMTLSAHTNASRPHPKHHTRSGMSTFLACANFVNAVVNSTMDQKYTSRPPRRPNIVLHTTTLTCSTLTLSTSSADKNEEHSEPHRKGTITVFVTSITTVVIFTVTSGPDEDKASRKFPCALFAKKVVIVVLVLCTQLVLAWGGGAILREIESPAAELAIAEHNAEVCSHLRRHHRHRTDHHHHDHYQVRTLEQALADFTALHPGVLALEGVWALPAAPPAAAFPVGAATAADVDQLQQRRHHCNFMPWRGVCAGA